MVSGARGYKMPSTKYLPILEGHASRCNAFELLELEGYGGQVAQLSDSSH
jgi:hypothetical protein